MSKFTSIFGGGEKRKPQQLPPEPQVSSGQSVPKRTAFCNVCQRDVSAIVNPEGQFATIVTVGEDPTRHQVSFIGSCPACDLDICGSCCGWTIDQSNSSPEVVARVPNCKQCGRRLVSKTEMDFSRLQQLLPRVMESQDNPDELRRVVRLLNDTSPACPPNVREANALLIQFFMKALDRANQ